MSSTQPAASSSALGLLLSLEKFQAEHRHVFPTPPSLRWFYRKNRAALIESGAVVELAGRLFINGPIFAVQALKIGSSVAAGRGERMTSIDAAQPETRKA